MKLVQAIELLSLLHATETGKRAEALTLAITVMEDEQERRHHELTRAERHLRLLLGSTRDPDRASTWAFLRGKLALPSETLDELDRRLGLPSAGKEES